MNSKSILKRTLPLIAVLVVVIAIAITCTVVSFDRDVPEVSEGTYATYKIGDHEYTVNNSTMYGLLKPQGVSTFVEWVDKIILEAEKNADGTSYLAAALADTEALSDLKKTQIYGENDLDELTDEEVDEMKQDYLDTMKSSGFSTVSAELTEFTNAEREYYAVLHARKLYAYDQLAKDIVEQDELAAADEDEDPYFTDQTIINYYNSEYRDDVWVLVVEYSSQIAATRALRQLGIVVDNRQWHWYDETAEDNVGDVLTTEEVFKAHIQLYNNANNLKNGGSVSETIPTIGDNACTFTSITTSTTVEEETTYALDVTKCEDLEDYLFYTYNELNTTYSAIKDRVYNARVFIEENTPEAEATSNSYQASAVSPSGSNYYYFIKLATIEQDALCADDEDSDLITNETLKAEIVEVLTENAKTDNLVTTKMAALRKDTYGLLIYDTSLETSYTSSYDSTFVASKEESKDSLLRITVDGEHQYLSVDDYFKLVNTRYGATYLVDLINRELVLTSSANKIINNYYPGMSYSEVEANLADSDARETFQDIKDSIQNLKNQFTSDAFSTYGFSSSYGWTNFLRDFFLNYYGVAINDEHDLAVYYVYQEVLSEYANTLNNYTENQDIKDLYTSSMQETYDNYFSAAGYHLLISVTEENSTNRVDPLASDTTWTTAQKDAAKALYSQVVSLVTVARNAPAALEDFVSQYNAAPYFTIYNAEGTLLSSLVTANQPNIYDPTTEASDPYIYTGLAGNVSGIEIEISYYKSLGLTVTYESLSSFGPGSMVENFEKVAKYIWDDMYDNDEITYDTSSSSWEVAEEKRIATLADVQAAFNGDTEADADLRAGYLVTEFGYHVYVQSSAQGYTGLSETENSVRVYNQVIVPSAELIANYLTIIESDEYKEIVEDENYSDGDEDDLLEENGIGEYELLCIETYYSPIATEMTGSNNISISLANLQLAGLSNLTLSHSDYDKDFYQYALDRTIEYNIEQLTLIADLYQEGE